jgi:uncharacterized protein YutE (UPF0331/DUF86 family)
VDIAKIVLASEARRIPETYREALRELVSVAGFSGDALSQAADFTRIRNLLAHEYLDMRYPEIRRFVTAAPAIYREIVRCVRGWMVQEG